MSIVAVLGATGAQGGSVVNELLQDPKWKVRGITRSVHSEKAKQLAQKRVDVVSADVNDESSLVKAFEGVIAIFAVTIYWDSVATLGRDGAGAEEVEQLKNIANAASKTPTLKHFVLSALPPAGKVSSGKLKVLHFDYKQKAIDWIAQNTPDLWSKTTEFWPGWYTSNLAYSPFMKFMPVPGSQGYALAIPSSPSALLPIAGDLQTNCGIVVRGILNTGAKAYGKVAICITDYRPMTDLIAEFEKLTGKPAAYLEISDKDMRKFWGDFGAEFASQLRWSESYPNWHDLVAGRVISMSELGVEGKLVNFEQALEALKDKLL
ncbi:NmrA-like family domain-containing protein 1 [Colletotrichum spaethianum]|uniref:NmrA-like family domain-containing protein 1 n=1 Tax=Colletotrichum spaethianum TaxID=700344 RepID=A0AA37PF25_9PEZI|nr:NmrA-like family domain-containing protein 1 [Colletotrichum spaethianum]GKT51111.1 NmrA-like family domain-containing protein 1 [Colletotrichum spaethianum]